MTYDRWTHWASQTHLTPEIANTVGTASKPVELCQALSHLQHLSLVNRRIFQNEYAGNHSTSNTLQAPENPPAKCHRLIRMNLQWLATKWVEAATPAREVFQDVSREISSDNENGRFINLQMQNVDVNLYRYIDSMIIQYCCCYIILWPLSDCIRFVYCSLWESVRGPSSLKNSIPSIFTSMLRGCCHCLKLCSWVIWVIWVRFWRFSSVKWGFWFYSRLSFYLPK